MDVQNLFDEKCKTIVQLQRKLMDYCSLYMNNRSIDQQLHDFRKITCTNLTQKKTFDDDLWTVNYKIGPVKATTKGFDESVCVNQCKSKLLQKLTFFWTGNNNGPSLAIRNQMDATTQIDLALQTGTEETRVNDQESVPENYTPRSDELTTKSDVLLSSNSLAETHMSADQQETKIGDDETAAVDSVSRDDDGGNEKYGESVTAAKNEPINGETRRENGVDDCPRNDGKTLSAADQTAVEHNEKTIKAVEVDRETSENRDSMLSSEKSATLISQCPSEPSSVQPKGIDSSAQNLEFDINDVPKINTIDVSSQSDVVESENNENDVVAKQQIEIEVTKAQESVKSCEDDRTPQEISIVHNSEHVDETKTELTIAGPEKPVDYEDESYAKLFDTVTGLLDQLSENTLPTISDCLVMLLVTTNDTCESLFNLIVEIIVQKAIDVYDDCPILAKLCSEIVKKISIDNMSKDRDVMAKRFKIHMQELCTVNMWGVEGQKPRNADFETHVRSLKTCRFLGHIFMLNEERLNIYFFVLHNIETFVKSSNAQSLECLCAFLMVAGSKLKKLRGSKSKLTLTKVYAMLEKCRTQERLPDNAVLSSQTVSILNELLLLRERRWKPE